jgi:hypothetical protein
MDRGVEVEPPQSSQAKGTPKMQREIEDIGSQTDCCIIL